MLWLPRIIDTFIDNNLKFDARVLGSEFHSCTNEPHFKTTEKILRHLKKTGT